MLKRLILALLALCISAAAAEVWSQQPQRAPSEPDKTTEADQRGTQKVPFVVEIAPTDDDRNKAKQQDKQERHKALVDEIVADATVAIAIFTLALGAGTGVLAAYTFRLWGATKELVLNEQKHAREVRSIIRGAGTIIRLDESGRLPHIFTIEASNAGEGAAVIDTVQWGFIEFRDLSRSEAPRYTRKEVSNEAVHPKTRTQIVKYVVVPPLDHAVIFFRLNYSDINRGHRASISHVMDLANAELPGVPIFVDAPVAYCIDTFPALEGR